MTAFLVVLVIILFGVAVMQMSRIFKMSRQQSNTSEIANDKDNNTHGWLMLAFVLFIYALCIYSFYEWGDVMLPRSASEHGVEIDQLWLISMIIIFVVGIITQWLLHYFAFKYRGEKSQKATFYADNDRLEFIWTIIPVIVLAGLIIYGLFTWTDIMNIDTDDDPLVVELYAYQFDWRARYGGEDNTLGEANVRLIEGINQLGVDASDPYAQDDVIVNELHLPKGRKILFKMRSQDVLHSAYMPHFRAQMNCVPGMITQFSFTPTLTTEEMRATDEMRDKVQKINKIRTENNIALAAAGEEQLEMYEFDYLLLCNKICGNSHYNMQMKIIVEDEEDFNAWMKEQQTLATVLKQ
ncbi:MAG: cytochrome c oxidase subunit II [Bacteroidia bacterium]|nr:cytochrome c oxidase subunit II [Bacteroidia bacterium]NNF30540.1 cytochrome c oxidase subunit II [Flavobacteriaceae bacterium]MBT8277126.1 cytochrome c oxidase subunit II [Bacteroidia bacterium]NNJ81054.1 cytochrome c oxidase subunit II [Flavobacteriaceae bacterium]NNK53887.1 cytochrome c oxidase subunit II [Flavobacteriaceae bacterium]